MLNTQNVALCLSSPLKFVSSAVDLSRVIDFRKEGYKNSLPSIEVAKNDPFNEYAYVIYSDDMQDNVNSTASFILDSDQGLPEDRLFPVAVDEYRKSGKKLMEIGRFVIDGKQGLLQHYYKAVYEVSIKESVDIVLMVIKQKNIPFHQRMIGVDVLSEDVNENFGTPYPFACVAWDIAKTKKRFGRWVASV